jgi:hypothetical protein
MTWEPTSCPKNSYFFFERLDIDGPLHDYYGVCRHCPQGTGKNETFYKTNNEYQVGEIECRNCTEINATACPPYQQDETLVVKLVKNITTKTVCVYTRFVFAMTIASFLYITWL